MSVFADSGAWWYILPVNPEPWEIGPLSVGRKGGKLFPIVGRDQQLHAYKQAIKEAILADSPVMMTGKLALSIWFWRNQATYETHQARTHRKHEADCTNMFKATEDALQGILFVNDKDNVVTRGYIAAQGPDVTPAVVIFIEPCKQLTIEQQLLEDVMPPNVRETFEGYRLLATTEGLLSANVELDPDEDWEGGSF